MWSKEELFKIQKLLLSADEDNQLLGLELLKPQENIDFFVPLLSFLAVTEYARPEVLRYVFQVLNCAESKLCTYWENVCSVWSPFMDGPKIKAKEIENIEKHIGLFDSFLEQSPRFSFFYNDFGRKLIEDLHRYEKGLEYLRKAAEANPDDYKASFYYAYYLPKIPVNIEIIISYYNNCLRLNNSYFWAHHYLGIIYLHKDDILKAIEIFQYCLTRSPQRWETMVQLSLALKKQGKVVEARELLEQAVRINPESHEVRNNFSALLWSEFGEYKQALKHIKKALKLLPGKGKYWHTLAEVEWYGFKNREKALAALYKAKEVQQHYKGGDQLIRELEAPF
jgi:tetratricopeptide (TPR) repeat protein